MRVRQYVYFGISSAFTTAAQMTARLGIEPDHFLVRASRIPEMDIPRSHQWRVECREPGLTIDEQTAKVLSRVLPQEQRIAELVSKIREEDPPGGACLQVVRYFNDEDGEDETSRETVGLNDGNELEKLTGQHQLLGWHLSQDVLAFLRVAGADVDVDEYS